MNIKVFGMIVKVMEALHAEVTHLADEANPIDSSWNRGRSLARRSRLRQIKEQIDELNAVDINTGR